MVVLFVLDGVEPVAENKRLQAAVEPKEGRESGRQAGRQGTNLNSQEEVRRVERQGEEGPPPEYPVRAGEEAAQLVGVHLFWLLLVVLPEKWRQGGGGGGPRILLRDGVWSTLSRVPVRTAITLY